MPNMIGALNEKPLHAALKQWYARPDDLIEVSVDGFTVDIVRGDLLIEIQTRNLSAIKRKASATRPSVSGRGIRTSGVTLKGRDQNSRLPVM